MDKDHPRQAAADAEDSRTHYKVRPRPDDDDVHSADAESQPPPAKAMFNPSGTRKGVSPSQPGKGGEVVSMAGTQDQLMDFAPVSTTEKVLERQQQQQQPFSHGLEDEKKTLNTVEIATYQPDHRKMLLNPGVKDEKMSHLQERKTAAVTYAEQVAPAGMDPNRSERAPTSISGETLTQEKSESTVTGDSIMESSENAQQDSTILFSEAETDALDPKNFLFRPPVTEKEAKAVSPIVRSRILNALDIIEKNGLESYQACLLKNQDENALTLSEQLEQARKEQELEEAIVRGDPRDYQMALFNLSKTRNIIVNLGTGKGKTLIALLAIRYHAAAFAEGKQTFFVVPSIALAAQQTTTLRANLPYSVETAASSIRSSELARNRLSGANIIVGTHGSILDLLGHYSDIFQMRRINLLVLDECHYATGNHEYAQIMKLFYHSISPPEDRPRVLGLTATALINVKPNVIIKMKPEETNTAISRLIKKLEDCLDSKLVSLADLGFDIHASQVLQSKAREAVVRHKPGGTLDPLPPLEGTDFHDTRSKEFNQLEHTYQQLGPHVLAVYAGTVAREVSRNSYAQETKEQFMNFVNLLRHVQKKCWEMCETSPTNGRNDKMLALEELLESMLDAENEGGGAQSTTVGVVFVERRVTAMALFDFFRHRQNRIDEGIWKRANELRLKTPATASTPAPDADGVSKGVSSQANEGNEMVASSSSQDTTRATSESQDNGLDTENAVPFDAMDVDALAASAPTASKDIINEANRMVAETEVKVPASVAPKTTTTMKESVTETRKSAETDTWRAEGGTQKNSNTENEPAENIWVNNPRTLMSKGTNIRCEVLVRDTAPVLTYVSDKHKLTTEQEKDKWLHKKKKLEEVMNRFRSRAVNVLIATSVVEEGVDVEACSFVIVLDQLKTTKSYIQMKGRARRKDADFFCFEEESQTGLTLKKAQIVERYVSQFIQNRAVPELQNLTKESNEEAIIIESEAEALRHGIYKAELGQVTIDTAKSLLNRYAFTIPLDISARSSRETMLLHMPFFDENKLTLPAHLPAEIRVIYLPSEYHDFPKKEKYGMLSLMACVRLHSHGLLNGRLLPLKREDFNKKLTSVAVHAFSDVKVPKVFPAPPGEVTSVSVYVCPIIQDGKRFSAHQKVLGEGGRKLALLSVDEIPVLPSSHFRNSELGVISMSMGEIFSIVLTKSQWDLCREFFAILFTARWTRKTAKIKLLPTTRVSYSVPMYIVGCLTKNNQLDWKRMERIVREGQRGEGERSAAVMAAGDMNELEEPRVWAPRYDPNGTYIAYGYSKRNCGAEFPENAYGIKTYAQYVEMKRGSPISSDCRLFAVQRSWAMTNNFVLIDIQKADKLTLEGKEPKAKEWVEGERYLCEGLRPALLAQDECMEATLADASLYLQSMMLPQFLFHFESILTARSFVEHASEHLPLLGSFLRRIPILEVTEALMAKSCGVEVSYEKLEWLGDAVLKLLHTDALLASRDLKAWISCLHEGDLSTLRSAMGSNERLRKACLNFGIHKFILIAAFGRGSWFPRGVESWEKDEEGRAVAPVLSENDMPCDKVCADVMESILGLLYLHFGYEASSRVALEMEISLAGVMDTDFVQSKITPKTQLIEAATKFVGRTSFRRHELVQEAFTHPSSLHEEVPCYQKLEWVGDAVLCLAAREWVYKNHNDLLLGRLVLMESTLVSNETLSYLGAKAGLHHFVAHNDQTLPGRFGAFVRVMEAGDRGLWGLDPPKVLSDIVEALVGAAHMDGTFEDGRRAARFVLSQLTDVLADANALLATDVMMHPKQSLYEIGGGALTVKSLRENKFAIQSPESLIWRGDGSVWNVADPDSNGAVASILLFGVELLSMGDHSSLVARNRSCAHVVALLKNDPDLLQKIQTCSKDFMRSGAAAGNSERKDSAGMIEDNPRRVDEGKGNQGVDERKQEHFDDNSVEDSTTHHGCVKMVNGDVMPNNGAETTGRNLNDVEMVKEDPKMDVMISVESG